MKKRFSVLIPTYERPEFTRRAIDSVLSQTFADHELIVVDDGSADDTPRLLESYGSRIRAMRQENRGPEIARRRGASVARGEYLVFLDSDDLLLPHALATYDRILRELGSPAVLLGAMMNFRRESEIRACPAPEDGIKVLAFRDFLSKDVGIPISNSKIVLRNDVFKEVNGMPGVYPFDDYDLMLRAGTHGPCVIVERPVTVAYRVHETNCVGNVEGMIHGLLFVIRKERRGRYPGGRARLFERYARIGGPAYEWIRKGFSSRRPGLALRLLLNGGPMVAAALARKSWNLVQKTATPLSLPFDPGPGSQETE